MSVKQHLLDKRNEILFALSLQEDYTLADISVILNIKHRSTILRILKRRPKNYISKWVKRDDI